MKTALVTGGSRGIGRLITESLSREGYRVAFLYRHSSELAEGLEASCGAKGFCCDVTSSEEVSQTLLQVLREYRHIDVLVNNAGIAQQKLFSELTDDDWRAMIDTHLTGAFYVTRAVLPSMIAQRFGRVINIGSIWGQVGASCEVHYSAAKAGLIGLTLALAKECAPSGVTVNCVCPGVIDTDMLSAFTDEEKREMASETPVGRLGTPQDVANAVLFLAKEESSFITGQVLGVNGGFGM